MCDHCPYSIGKKVKGEKAAPDSKLNIFPHFPLILVSLLSKALQNLHSPRLSSHYSLLKCGF